MSNSYTGFLGSITTNVTIYILIGIDQFINVCLSIKILRTKQNPTKENIKKLIATVQILVIVESLEFLIPLTYLFCFIAAYHGPNSETLGNVKNSYGQYRSVDDLWGAINSLLLLVVVDFLALFSTGIVLFLSSSINLLHVFLHVMNEYGLIFSINTVFILVTNFIAISINCALDTTLQFDWVLNQEKWHNLTHTANATSH